MRHTFTTRCIGSALLNPRSYEDVELDPHANGQAIATVLISSLAGVIGAGIQGLENTASALIAIIVSWILWVLLTLLIGVHILPGSQTRADFGQLLRTTGFSAAPGVFRIFGLVPLIGGFLYWGAMLWMLFSFVVAVRQALDYESTGRALAVSLLGWLIHGILFFGFVGTAI